MKRGTSIFIICLIGVYVVSVITMDVYTVVYEQKNPTITDEIYLNSYPPAMQGWGWDSSDIYRPISKGVSIEYSVEINVSVVTSSVGIYFIEENDLEIPSMTTNPDNYTIWLETNTDKWNGGIIKSRSSLRSIVTGKIQPSINGVYLILGINVFQVYSFKVILEYKINNWFNIVSKSFVDITKSSFAIAIPVATILLIIDRVIGLIRLEPRKETKKEKGKSKNKKE